MYNNTTYKVEEVGHFLLKREKREKLSAGEVGYIIAGVKTVADVRTGDTITLQDKPCSQPLPGFKEVKPVVFASIYPIASDDYQDLADSLEKLKLNDASFIFEKDSSVALGQGLPLWLFRTSSSGYSSRKDWKENMIFPLFCPYPACVTASRSKTTRLFMWITPHTIPDPAEIAKGKNLISEQA